jgi:hypothetical protein
LNVREPPFTAAESGFLSRHSQTTHVDGYELKLRTTGAVTQRTLDQGWNCAVPTIKNQYKYGGRGFGPSE